MAIRLDLLRGGFRSWRAGEPSWTVNREREVSPSNSPNAARSASSSSRWKCRITIPARLEAPPLIMPIRATSSADREKERPPSEMLRWRADVAIEGKRKESGGFLGGEVHSIPQCLRESWRAFSKALGWSLRYLLHRFLISSGSSCTASPRPLTKLVMSSQRRRTLSSLR